jgi:hypothetical protein
MEQFEFLVTSSKVCLSDPCYEKGTWCGEYDVPALNGRWEVEVKHTDGRVSEFTAYHKDHSGDTMFSCSTEYGVDSGQFGIFDSSIYEPETPFEDKDKFYGSACATTLCDERCGVVFGKGFVCRSGYGDGGYDGCAAYQFGNLVKFSIVFIHEDEDDDD